MIRDNARSSRTGGRRVAALISALVAGFAAVGHAEAMPQLVVTAHRAPPGTSVETLRDTMQAKAEGAVSATRASVTAELGVRLNEQNREFRVAANEPGKRG